MSATLAGIALGLHAAGLIQAVFVIGFLLMRVPSLDRAALPAAYAVALASGFVLPLMEGAGLDPGLLNGTGLSLLDGALPAIAYLFVLTLVFGQVPHTAHYLVLSLPAIALPWLMVTTQFGDAPVCLFEDAASCLPAEPALRVYDIIAGGVILLGVMLAARRRLVTLSGDATDREKRMLVLAIVALQAVLLGLDLVQVFDAMTRPNLLLLSAFFRLSFFYLIALSVFLIFPRAFDLPANADEVADPAPPAATASARRELAPGDADLLQRIEKLMTLDKLYQEPGFSRRQLAEELGVAEHHVTRLLNVGLDRTFPEMVNAYRVEEARQLLAGSDLPVSQIAFDVGFNSLASFNRVFKSATDVSPTAFRESARTVEEGAAQPAVATAAGGTGS